MNDSTAIIIITTTLGIKPFRNIKFHLKSSSFNS